MSHRAATLAALPEDQSWQSRLCLWRGTAQMVAAHPVLGVGLGRYPGCQWFWTHSGAALSPQDHPSLSNEAHSFYGQTAAETGLIPGLCAVPGGTRGVRGAGAAAAPWRQPRRPSAERAERAADWRSSAPWPGSLWMRWQVPVVAVPGSVVFILGRAGPGAGVSEAATRLRRRFLPRLSPAAAAEHGQLGAVRAGLTVALAAQMLPLGLLLTPVEAYTAPSKAGTRWLPSALSACIADRLPSPPAAPCNTRRSQQPTRLLPARRSAKMSLADTVKRLRQRDGLQHHFYRSLTDEHCLHCRRYMTLATGEPMLAAASSPSISVTLTRTPATANCSTIPTLASQVAEFRRSAELGKRSGAAGPVHSCTGLFSAPALSGAVKIG